MEAVTESSFCSVWQVCNPMPWQLLNPTEELAPHTNDPQRSVGLSNFGVLKKYGVDRALEHKTIISTKSK